MKFSISEFRANRYEKSFKIKERSELNRGLKTSYRFQERIDEYDYSKPLDGQTKRPFDQHWRKHTLVWTDHNTGKV